VNKKERLPEDGLGARQRETHSGIFTDEELNAMPSYTKEELAALPEPWTRWGEMLPEDKRVVQGTVDHDYAASRIFVTGEASEDYLGELGVKHLLSINDVYYENGADREPLFVRTRDGTVRMARFDPRIVWRWFHPDTLVDLVKDEIDRLGVNMDPWKMDYFDFYQNMTEAIKDLARDEVAVMVKKESGIGGFYHEMYLSCLLLFGKPGYMNVPVSTHFARKEAADFMRDAEVYRLNDAALNKLDRLREEYGGLRSLTNPELHFIIDILEGALK
jgi:hypothetical protein